VSVAKTLLLTRDLTIHFGGITALDRVDIACKPGEIVGVLGPNGAGKTTLFNVISGFLRPTRGTIELDDQEIQDLLPYERVELGLGRTFQQVRLFRNLTVMENLLVAQHRHLKSGAVASMLRLPSWHRDERLAQERVEAILEVVDLRPWADAYPSQLSYGTLRFLELASVLSLQPRILLLDEPASGLDPRARVELRELLRELRSIGKTIVISSHILPELEELCTAVAIIDRGRVLASGSVADIGKRLRVGEVLRVRVLGGDETVDAGLAWFRGRPDVASAERLEDGMLELAFRGDEHEAAALLSAAVGAGIVVASYAPAATDLQELFLQVTGRDEPTAGVAA
jgi:branched-chain amino acid transport system ATP-binding protein